MSILIKGMEMPKSCYDCSFAVEVYDGSGVYACVVTDKCVCRGAGRHDDCPLVPVPPHGRLIDADALKEAFCGNCFADEKPMECSEPCMDMRIILEAPTIIPAEEGE